MKMKKVVIPVIIIVLFVGWYWFRPERLVINRRVDEGFPTGNGSLAQVLESGAFHSGTHPTAGSATIYGIANGSRILRFTNFKTSIGASSRGTLATKTIRSAPMWTWRSTVPCLSGANGLARISVLHH